MVINRKLVREERGDQFVGSFTAPSLRERIGREGSILLVLSYFLHFHLTIDIYQFFFVIVRFISIE